MRDSDLLVMITLKNGKRVGNFSSPHPFVFEDNTVLPGVPPKQAEWLKVKFIETVVDPQKGDIELKFKITHQIRKEMSYWMDKFIENEVDVVFCPLPMITALKEEGYLLNITPFRAIRIEDRIKKLVSTTKQCL